MLKTVDTDKGGGVRTSIHAALGGMGAAVFVFLAIHRVDIGGGASFQAYGLALLSLITGWALGTGLLNRWVSGPLRRRLAVAALAMVAGVLRYAPPATPRSTLFLAAGGGASLLGMIWGGRERGGRTGRIGLAGGMAIMFVLLAAGITDWIGMDGVLLVIGIPVLAAGLFLAPGSSISRNGDGEEEAIAEGGWMLRVGQLALSMAIGGLLFAFLRMRVAGTGWFAYAAVDVGVGFVFGLLMRHLAAVSVEDAAGMLAVRGVGVILISLLAGWSFVFYPSVVLSEPAVQQTGPALLTAARCFPIWIFSALLAFLLPANHPGGGRGSANIMASAAGVAVILALPASGPGYYGYLLCLIFALVAMIPVAWRVVSRRSGWRAVLIPVLMISLGVVGLLWAWWVPQNADWPGLRYSFAWYQRDNRGRLNAPRPADLDNRGSDGVRTTDIARWNESVKISVESGGESGYFTEGALAGTSRIGSTGPVALMGAAVRMAAERPERIAFLGQNDEVTDRMAGALYAGAEVLEVSPHALRSGRIQEGSFDGLFVGPAALADFSDVPKIMNVGTLRAAGRAVGEKGVVCLWMPTRTVDPGEFRSLVATLRAAFGQTFAFVCRDELVFLARPAKASEEERRIELNYSAARGMFRKEQQRAFLEEAGYWDPRQLVGAFLADDRGLAKVAGNAAPMSVWRPARPPVLTRDLARLSRSDVMAMLVPLRLGTRGFLADHLVFSTAVERRLARRFLRDSYREHTFARMRQIGDVAKASADPDAAVDSVVAILQQSEVGDFAPEVEEKAVRLAVALYRFGLYERALNEMARRTAGRMTAEMHYWRGRCLEKLEEGTEAIEAYEKLREMGEADTDVLMRIASLHLRNRQLNRGRRRLEEVLDRDPDHVGALVRLGYISGEQGRYAQALNYSRRALEIDPENSAAREQEALYRWMVR
ncbi:MAG: tetratricopeptide repeat protein [Planctomycetota bacterium]